VIGNLLTELGLGTRAEKPRVPVDKEGQGGIQNSVGGACTEEIGEAEASRRWGRARDARWRGLTFMSKKSQSGQYRRTKEKDWRLTIGVQSIGDGSEGTTGERTRYGNIEEKKKFTAPGKRKKASEEIKKRTVREIKTFGLDSRR